jgi:hypothetical protein
MTAEEFLAQLKANEGECFEYHNKNVVGTLWTKRWTFVQGQFRWRVLLPGNRGTDWREALNEENAKVHIASDFSIIAFNEKDD